MKLYESEGKELLLEYGLNVPLGIVESVPCMAKVQTLIGGRGLLGKVKLCKTSKELGAFKKLNKGHSILTEEFLAHDKEFFACFTFDRAEKSSVLLFNVQGGVNVDVTECHKFVLSPLFSSASHFEVMLKSIRGLSYEDVLALSPMFKKLYELFVDEDCKSVEINPITIINNHAYCLDCKIELDDNAKERHLERKYEYRNESPIVAEQKVSDASNADHKGNVKYVQLDSGNIGFLVAGGGASLICMDEMFKHGLKPANYSEFSGNPSVEKLKVLFDTVMSQPNLKGLLVAGAISNFSRVDEMLKVLVECIGKHNPAYPVMIRRAGMSDENAKEIVEPVKQKHMVSFYDENLTLPEAVAILAEQVRIVFGAKK